MREVPLSICEKEFILAAIADRKRLDGRGIYDYRRLQITFGVDRGCCQVAIGNTRVLAQVSCEVTTPKQARPSEGILFVNVELSPMASPKFEAGRQSAEGIELNRLLERCLKESRCVDTESLCIKSGIKVWQVRCDLHVLNQDGNMLDCASVAAIAALMHFRRPDVTVSGEEITIHSMEDRDPIPLSVHHMPLCVTFAFYHQGKFLLVDPSLSEEGVMEGKLIVGMNKHREVCTLQMTGSMLLLKDQVLRCSNIAVVKVTEMTQLIHTALQNDTKARAEGKDFGFAASVEPNKVTSLQVMPSEIAMDGLEDVAANIVKKSEEISDESSAEDNSDDVVVLGKGTAMIGEGGANTWALDDSDEVEILEEMQAEHKHEREKVSSTKEGNDKLTLDIVELSGDSEEEEVVMLTEESSQMTISKDNSTKKKPAPAGGHIDLSKALKGKKQKKKAKQS